ncbi:complement decay-accelerating factor-like [Latimeria chalumnae]|uniref:complement decay-accelerating factor-like n=1 Tax=Latimeria chalumnae TaxID=7897 RepID=UPI00313C21A3
MHALLHNVRAKLEVPDRKKFFNVGLLISGCQFQDRFEIFIIQMGSTFTFVNFLQRKCLFTLYINPRLILTSDVLLKSFVKKGGRLLRVKGREVQLSSPKEKDSIIFYSSLQWNGGADSAEEPSECEVPPDLPDATLHSEFLLLNEFPEGINVTYRCNNGYIKKSSTNPVASCLHNSEWTIPFLNCTRKDCGSPGNALNAQFTLQKDTQFGSTATYTCNKGYKLIGRNTRQCLVDGWDNGIPTCEIVPTDAPVTVTAKPKVVSTDAPVTVFVKPKVVPTDAPVTVTAKPKVVSTDAPVTVSVKPKVVTTNAFTAIATPRKGIKEATTPFDSMHRGFTKNHIIIVVVFGSCILLIIGGIILFHNKKNRGSFYPREPKDYVSSLTSSKVSPQSDEAQDYNYMKTAPV